MLLLKVSARVYLMWYCCCSEASMYWREKAQNGSYQMVLQETSQHKQYRVGTPHTQIVWSSFSAHNQMLWPVRKDIWLLNPWAADTVSLLEKICHLLFSVYQLLVLYSCLFPSLLKDSPSNDYSRPHAAIAVIHPMSCSSQKILMKNLSWPGLLPFLWSCWGWEGPVDM